MRPSVHAFVQSHLTRAEVEGKSVVEVGSLNVNGTVRDYVMSLGPAEYVGIDIRAGDGVDEVCDVADLVRRFGRERFDVVISTETLEHVEDWKSGITNMKNVCVTGGILLLTAASRGFPFHQFPGDFWRFEVEDMKRIFSDFDVEVIEPDPVGTGVFVKVRKPVGFRERDLSDCPVARVDREGG
jgi:SAM-dependent methyltransferase